MPGTLFPVNPEVEPDLILVVDDTPRNLQVLGTILHEKGYEVAAARSGAQALSILEHTRPCLILLDVMMPEMDGYEVLSRIRSNPATAEIPVIFITARVEAEEVVRGFNAGAADYIAKPFNAAELLARVNVHLCLKKNNDRLNDLNRRLRLQARELEKLNREKNDMMGIVAHDLKNPIANIISIAESPELADAAADIPKFGYEMERIIHTGRGMLNLIENLLNINAIEEGLLELNHELTDVRKLGEHMMSTYRSLAERKGLRLLFDFPDGALFPFKIDRDALCRILDNLVSNAIKYSPSGGHIVLKAEIETRPQRLLHFSVTDQGPGLTADDMEQLFGKFRKLSAKPTGGESSTGLGLAIAKKLADRLKGNIFVESEPGRGAVFTVSVPEA
ncbi:MAG: hybrid sensor histidine kinase/response regulator [Bacteroidota bacterium]